LRGARVYNITTQEEHAMLLNNLTVQHGKWIFRTFESAKLFAEKFKLLNDTYWSGIPTLLMFRTVGDYVKYALDCRYITRADLFTTDTEVLKKIAQHIPTDAHLQKLFTRLNHKAPYSLECMPGDTKVFCKSRAVNPSCMHNGKTCRVSDINPAWGARVTRDLQPKEYCLTFQDEL
jgi:hypothetical protein